MAESAIQRVRIYLNGEDRAGDRPLYQAVLAELRQSGATGATAIAALAGFGPRRQTSPGVERQPIVIEWVDHAARIKRLLPLIAELTGQALITIEAVDVAQGGLRPAGLLGDEQLVADLMQPTPPFVAADAPLVDVLEQLIARRTDLLPVVDGETVIGVISNRELAWRAGFRLAPELLAALEATEEVAVVAPLKGRTAGEIVNREVRGVAPTTSIPEGLTRLVEWGYGQAPVVDAEGRLIGMFGQREVLQALARQTETTTMSSTSVQVHMVMQAATPRIALGQSLAAALALLLTAPGHLLFVVDDQSHLAGVLRLTSVLRHLQGEERAALITALQRAQPAPAAALPGGRRALDPLVESAPAVVPVNASLPIATRQLLDANAERLPVIDSDGRLSGIIARGGLIRALLQQSE